MIIILAQMKKYVSYVLMTRTQMTLTNVNVGISMEISIVDYLIIYWMAST